MSLRHRRPAVFECCDGEVAAGVACSGCGKVAGRTQARAVTPPPVASKLPVREASTAALVGELALPKPRREVRAPRSPRQRKPLRPRNAERHSRRLASDFGPLADAVRRLPCCVEGCRGRAEPAHVRSRGSRHGAWIVVDGVEVGNIVPLCRSHHTGGPGMPSRCVQHKAGTRAFERDNPIMFRLPTRRGFASSLAEIAAAIGEWYKAGCPGGDGTPY